MCCVLRVTFWVLRPATASQRNRAPPSLTPPPPPPTARGRGASPPALGPRNSTPPFFFVLPRSLPGKNFKNPPPFFFPLPPGGFFQAESPSPPPCSTFPLHTLPGGPQLFLTNQTGCHRFAFLLGKQEGSRLAPPPPSSVLSFPVHNSQETLKLPPIPPPFSVFHSC